MADGERGQWHCRLICEEDPPVLQVVCHFPIPVPKCKLLSASLLIHNMNLHVRLGAFTLAEEGRRIGFRLPFLIRPEVPMDRQFKQAIHTTWTTCDEAFQALALFACDTPEANKLLEEVRPKAGPSG